MKIELFLGGNSARLSAFPPGRSLSMGALFIGIIFGLCFYVTEVKAESITVALFDLSASDEPVEKKKDLKQKTTAQDSLLMESSEAVRSFADERLRIGLQRNLMGQSRFEYIDTQMRSTLLDPAWSPAPSNLEEALELGRELGVDWAIQGKIKRLGSNSYRINLYLIALSSSLWLDRAETRPTESPLLVDFNTIPTGEMLLAEHIIWASKSDRLEHQLDKAGLRLLYKAEQAQLRRKSALTAPVNDDVQEEAEAEDQVTKELSQREREVQELSDAARRELDDIQARLDAEHLRRQEEVELKQEALSAEASRAWRILEDISGGAGLTTVSVEEIKPQKRRSASKRKNKRKRAAKRYPIVKPKRVTWAELNRATRKLTDISDEEHRQLLLNFIRTYERILPDYQAQVAEARHRFTWLNRDTIEWIPIRGGRFQVGSTFPVADERPMQWIEISAFEAAVSEVTNAQYKRCVDARVCTPPHWDDKSCEIFSDLHLKRGVLPASMRRGDMPVVCVDWSQANRFAKWVGGRLLSETEWEFVARSGEKSFIYPWGRDAAHCGLAVMHSGSDSGCGFGIPWPVCSKAQGKSHIGLCDLAGNVWEWVTDQYRPNHELVPPDGRPFTGGGRKVIKGGSFSSNYKELYSSTRGQLSPNGRSNSVGFRVARPEQETR